MEVTRIFDLLERYKNNFPKPDALAAKENGKWITFSTEQFIEAATNTAYGLLALGVKPGDKISLISNNRPEWNFADFGMQLIGVINVPVYPTISESDLTFILQDAEISYVIVSNNSIYNKVNQIAAAVPTLKGIYSFDKIAEVPHFSELLELGKTTPAATKVEAIKSSIKAADMATILYTSGTTNRPKGVMLSHNNIISNVLGVRNLAPVDSTSKALSFLPLNHSYERMLTYLWIYLGVPIYYAESLDTISDNLKEVKPHIFTTVPRLLEKVYDKIVAKGHEQKGIKKALFFWALNLGLRYEINGKNGWWYELQLKLANKIIFNKWREALGGQVRAIVSGGAALQPRLARVFWAARIPVLEGYGLTETSPVVSVNNFEPNGLRFTTVGPLIEKVEVKLAEDGEILVKGPNVMLGYYKRPDLTAEAIIDDWFHTGDIGVFVENRFLKITDRKKEIFKTSGGKYIAPQIIENKLKESPFIEQAMVIGENQKFPAALIVPAFAYLKEWCVKKGIPVPPTNEELIAKPEVVARLQEELKKVNEQLASYEAIKKIILLPREWSIDRGELTPKLSMKRKVILDTNKALIDKVYHLE